MSPEQAAGDPALLGPRSDVYSLGATLYFLLTGHPPFRGSAVNRVLHAVRAGEFPPPRQVDRSIDAALEAICLKAMALRPEDRYASARALAEDVERWLADEPTSARRDPLAERARRWVRRRKTAAAAAAASTLVALVGLATVLAVQARANADLRAANARERARFDLALAAIRTFHTGVSEDVLLRQAEFKALRDRLLGGAVEFYRKLEGLLTTQSDRRSRQALARAYYEVGGLTSRIGSPEQALTAHRQALTVRRALAEGPRPEGESRAEVGRSLLAIGAIQEETGRMGEAMASYEAARAGLESLVRSDPNASAFQADLAAAHRSIGWLLAKTGHEAEARTAFERARDVPDARRGPSGRRPARRRPGGHPPRPRDQAHSGPSIGGGPRGVRAGPRDPRGEGESPHRRPPGPERPGREPLRHRLAAPADRPDGRGDRGLRAVAGDPGGSAQGQSHRRLLPARPGHEPQQPGRGAGAGRPRRRGGLGL
jgi:serine/threonine-protein kinase